MPTGYTSIIADGDPSFEEYAWRCARAFGALILMRDDAMDAPIPQFTVDKYYVESEAKARAKLAELRGATIVQANALGAAEYEAAHAFYIEQCERVAATRARYERMLAHVDAWTPPTPDHESLKKFMREQIESSIRFDTYEPTPPTRLVGQGWLDKALAEAERSLAYAEKSLAEEQERIKNRDEWVAALRKSIGPQPREART